MRYLVSIISNITCPVSQIFGQVTASSTGSIPAGSQSWSLSVSGAAATIGGQAVPTGFAAVGASPLANAIAIVTGSGTTVTYSYGTSEEGNNNPG